MKHIYHLVGTIALMNHLVGTSTLCIEDGSINSFFFSPFSFSFQLAVCMGTPILTPDWIHKAWERRDDM